MNRREDTKYVETKKDNVASYNNSISESNSQIDFDTFNLNILEAQLDTLNFQVTDKKIF